jgi:mono/diheme cytochrome c family protein
MRVVPAGTAVAALPPADRGRQLFVAKGCMSCHAKRDDRTLPGRNDANVGPDLTGRTYPADWLAAKLADPARNRVRANEYVLMPNLGLSEREIASLTGYLNQRMTDGVAGR